MSLKKLQIFVEGKTDKKIIEDFLKYKFPEKKDLFLVRDVGGKDRLGLALNSFNKNTDVGGINLILFDADSSENLGGFTKRLEELKSKIAELQISSEIFLFPNHKDDGDLETLLCSIAIEKHKVIFDCWEKYEDCLKSNKNHSYTIPSRKSKVYAYLEALLGKTNKEKELISKPDYTNKEHWDLSHQNLNPLYQFIKENIDILQK